MKKSPEAMSYMSRSCIRRCGAVFAALVVLLASSVQPCMGFAALKPSIIDRSYSRAAVSFSSGGLAQQARLTQERKFQPNRWISLGGITSTQLGMYNLPPGGGNGGKELLTGALSLLAIVAFFASPLGGIFFAIVNSFFLVSLLTPLVFWIVFQTWQFFNTIEGPCPNCSVPLRVVKDPNSPSFCLNCGTVVQATDDGQAIEFYSNNNLSNQVIVDDFDDFETSIFDNWFGGGTKNVPSTPEERQARYRRETTIIDVDIDDRK